MYISRRGLLRLSAALPLSGFPSGSSYAGDAALRIVISQAAGGGNDANARLISQHLEGHYGNALTLENQPKAGGRLALREILAADDLAICTLPGSLVIDLVTGSQSALDANDFMLLDNFVVATRVIAIHRRVGLSSMAEWQKSGRALNIGVQDLNGGAMEARYVSRLCGCKVNIIPGYEYSEARAAFVSGELELIFGSYSSIKKFIEKDTAVMVARSTASAGEDAEADKLPPIESAVTDKSMLALQPFFTNRWRLQAAFLGPRSKRELLAPVLSAMSETKRDPAFLAAASQSQLVVDRGEQSEIQNSFAALMTDLPVWRGLVAPLLAQE